MAGEGGEDIDSLINPALATLAASEEDQRQARYSYFPRAYAPQVAPLGAASVPQSIALEQGNRRVQSGARFLRVD